MPINFTTEELRARPDIKLELDFYKSRFIPTYKLYAAMDHAEQQRFIRFLKANNYYNWLEIDDEQVAANPEILPLIAAWVVNLELIVYLEEINAAIGAVYAPYSGVHKEIMRGNQLYIKSLDYELAHKIQALIAPKAIDDLREQKPSLTSLMS